MWSASDEALVAGLAARDPDATEAFVARFQRRVYGLARVITNDEILAEDVAQEALLRAWRHASTYDPRRGSVVSWLLTITRNLSIDQVRVRRPQVVDPDDLLVAVGPAPGPGPAEAAEVMEEIARLRLAIAALPIDQRRAIVLTGVLGLSGREVAEVEEIPLGTAKTRIRTAMIRLRAALAHRERAE